MPSVYCSRTHCCALWLWTMMAELLCFSVDDFIVFSSNFCNSSSVIATFCFCSAISAKQQRKTASEYDICGHRRCWTAAGWCPYYSCRRRAEPVGLVLPCVYCSRTRCCALWLWTMMAELCFSVDDFIVLFSSNFSNSSSVIASYFVFF